MEVNSEERLAQNRAALARFRRLFPTGAPVVLPDILDVKRISGVPKDTWGAFRLGRYQAEINEKLAMTNSPNERAGTLDHELKGHAWPCLLTTALWVTRRADYNASLQGAASGHPLSWPRLGNYKRAKYQWDHAARRQSLADAYCKKASASSAETVRTLESRQDWRDFLAFFAKSPHLQRQAWRFAGMLPSTQAAIRETQLYGNTQSVHYHLSPEEIRAEIIGASRELHEINCHGLQPGKIILNISRTRQVQDELKRYRLYRALLELLRRDQARPNHSPTETKLRDVLAELERCSVGYQETVKPFLPANLRPGLANKILSE